jgi:hypothetical protein
MQIYAELPLKVLVKDASFMTLNDYIMKVFRNCSTLSFYFEF